MSAIDRSDFSLSGILPVVPRFDFEDTAAIEAPAQWEAMAAMYDYEENVRPIARDWADKRAHELWQIKKPWFCYM